VVGETLKWETEIVGENSLATGLRNTNYNFDKPTIWAQEDPRRYKRSKVFWGDGARKKTVPARLLEPDAGIRGKMKGSQKKGGSVH